MKLSGPSILFTAWAVHDVEEALAFTSTFAKLADRTGFDGLRIGRARSWAAVGIMGVAVAAACWRGHRTGGRSKAYRAVVAGLEGHVYTHLLGTAVQRGYTAGVATAVPIMLSGAIAARRELLRAGMPLRAPDYLLGGALLLPGAVISQALARIPVPSPQKRDRSRKRHHPLKPQATARRPSQRPCCR